MRFRHLACRRRFEHPNIGADCVKIGQDKFIFVDNARNAIVKRNIHPGTVVTEQPARSWENRAFVGSFDPTKFSSADTGKYVARLRLKSGQSIVVVGKMSEINAHIDALGDEFASWQSSQAIRENDVLTEREFRKWAILEDALAALLPYA